MRKDDIDNLILKRDFDETFEHLILKSKKKHVEIDEKKVTDHITSYTKLTNDLSANVKLISTKELKKYLINRYSVLNDAKYFAEDAS